MIVVCLPEYKKRFSSVGCRLLSISILFDQATSVDFHLVFKHTEVMVRIVCKKMSKRPLSWGSQKYCENCKKWHYIKIFSIHQNKNRARKWSLKRTGHKKWTENQLKQVLWWDESIYWKFLIKFWSVCMDLVRQDVQWWVSTVFCRTWLRFCNVFAWSGVGIL